MKPVEIYTTPICGYCHAAKRLLTLKGVAFTEVDVSRDANLRDTMTRRSNGGRTSTISVSSCLRGTIGSPDAALIAFSRE